MCKETDVDDAQYEKELPVGRVTLEREIHFRYDDYTEEMIRKGEDEMVGLIVFLLVIVIIGFVGWFYFF